MRNVIIGDFNLRIGVLGKRGSDLEGMDRSSKDKCLGNGGRKFMDWVIQKGWEVLNGCIMGDWEGEYTYVEARSS